MMNSSNPKQYIKDIRRRDPELSKGWGQIATTLVVEREGGTAAREVRKQLEQVTGKPVVSHTNFLNGFIEDDMPLLDEK